MYRKSNNVTAARYILAPEGAVRTAHSGARMQRPLKPVDS